MFFMIVVVFGNNFMMKLKFCVFRNINLFDIESDRLWFNEVINEN